MNESLDQIDWEKGDGLVPAIVQDVGSGTVLMLGYMNEASLKKTIETRKVTFFSRSRQALWTKGETSGNYLTLKHISVDCDQDAILVEAVPHGPTCHKNSTSCFGESSVMLDPSGAKTTTLHALENDISERILQGSADSYTVSLMKDGTARVAQKVGEEAVEVVIASLQPGTKSFLDETADLLYHLLVLVRAKGLTLADVEDVLEARRK